MLLKRLVMISNTIWCLHERSWLISNSFWHMSDRSVDLKYDLVYGCACALISYAVSCNTFYFNVFFKLSISEKSSDAEDERLQLQALQEKYLHVTQMILIISFYDPAFSNKHLTGMIFLLPILHSRWTKN